MKLILNAILFILLSNQLISIQCASILVYLPFSAKSHHIAFNPIIKKLAERGHQVTAYKTLPLDGQPVKNYKEIILPNYLEQLKDEINFNVVEWGKSGFIPQLIGTNQIGYMVVEASYKTKEFQQLMKTKEKFDVVLTESLFSQYSAAAFSHRFNAHQIVLMPLGNAHWTNFITSNPYSPSYIPDFNTLATSDMNFIERFTNTVKSIITILVQQFYFIPEFEKQIDKYFIYEGSSTRPPLTKMLSNISLVIENSHMSLNGATPKAPNHLSVGGLNIKPTKPLPPNIKKWIDEAKDGCIYFSYGTVVQGGHIDRKVLNAYVSAFSKIKQRVLWKIDEKVDVSNNVMIDSWMPQQDILAHPNIKIFITHGGYLSVNEAVNYGVPLIGTPFFGDQAKNLLEVTKSGYGLQLDYDNITEESILWSINEILNNKRYKETVQKKSEIYKDRQNSPVDTAIYWIEYVIKHNGAPHLRPQSAFMPWYQSELIDVGAVLLVIILSFLYVNFLMIRKCYLFLTCQTWGKNKKQKLS